MKFLVCVLFFTAASCSSQPKSNRTELDLANQNLRAIPDSVFSFTNLEYLQLGNRFKLYPPLSSFKDSLPNMNTLAELPKDIKRLTQLKVLKLAFIGLRSLPTEMTTLRNLDTLDLFFNEQLNIASVSNILEKMTWLKYLDVVATNADSTTIEKLRKALPTTRIDAKFTDYEIETITVPE